MFAPAATRAQDEILFMLLEHLHTYPVRVHLPSGFDQAREAEVRRKDLDRFLKYEQEIATSSKDIPRRLVEVHKEAAGTTSKLRKAFKAVLESLKPEGELLLVLVDDLDLQPHRALELLEILHLFMNVKGVVVLIAADKDLLLHSIDLALKREKRHHPGLASALLAKYIPHEWLLPTPGEGERLDLLTGSEVATWWPEDVLHGLGEARAARRHRELQKEREQMEGGHVDSEEEELIFATPKEMIERFLLPLAPITYRGLKAFHNRLVSWRERLESTRARADGDLELDRRLAHQYSKLTLNRYLLRPFLTMMVAFDVRWPELDLLGYLERSPGVVERVFDELVVMDDAKHEPETIARSNDPYELLTGEWPGDLPVLGEFLQPESRLTRGDLGEAKRTLRELARVWNFWRRSGGGVEPEGRFLTITVRPNANAFDESRRIWRSIFLREVVEDWHLDLRSFVKSENPSPEEIRRTRDASIAYLREKMQVADVQGRLEIFARAPLSYLVWLGWSLDRQKSVVVYNADAKKPFEGPLGRLRFPDREYETADVAIFARAEGRIGGRSAPRAIEAGGAIEVGGAIAIIDVTMDHKVQPEHLDRFRRGQASVNSQDRCLFTRRSAHAIEPEDLVPILRDVLELIGRLHRDRGILHLHLALAGPDVVAFFLGRQLKAQGIQISLYEFYGDHYEWVFDLEENASVPA